MNIALFSFGLFVLWLGVAVCVLFVAPIVYPRMLNDPSGTRYFMAFGAGMLALWNFVRWWSLRQFNRRQALQDEMEEAYRRHSNPPQEERDKPVVRPEFQFEDDERTKIPPPPSPNGFGH